LNIVRAKRLTLVGHILRLPSDRPASVAMQWEPDGGRRRRGHPRKTWRQTFREDLQKMRVRVVFAEWPVIEVGGKVSSPSAPAGVGGSKSKMCYVTGLKFSLGLNL